MNDIEYYCTYFDHNYLRKGLALYLSLRRNSRPCRTVLIVLALSRECEQILRALSLPDLFVLPLNNLEAKYPSLIQSKLNRSKIEYYFTLTPWLIKYSLDSISSSQRVTYLDSDLYFFNSPQPLWDEIQSAPVVMVEHRFSPSYQDKQIYGRFNVGWNTFDRSKAGSLALEWWADSCANWCYDRVEGNKFADQGYLTTLYDRTPHTHILQYPGVNLAEYNLDNYDLTLDSHGPNANALPVIYWHMHGLFESQDGKYSVMLRDDLFRNPVINWAYNQYILINKSLKDRLQKLGLPVFNGNIRYPHLA